MTDVVFWLPAINPYWNDRFKALAKDGRVTFSCWFNSHIDPTRSWKVDRNDMLYPHEFLPGSPTARYYRAAQLYKQSDPDRLFTFHFDPALWPAWCHWIRGRHLALYTLMTWDTWVKRARHKEVAKRWFFGSASSVLTPGPDSDAWAKRYGARTVFRLHHAVDTEGLATAAAQRVRSERLRVLYVGRYVQEKGLDHLLRVIEETEALGVEVEWRFVGSGPYAGELQRFATSRPNVRVDGFVTASELPSVYAQSDVLVFPTLGDPYGLVVDEALAAGMPVVSSAQAGDIGWRLAEGRGYVLEVTDHRLWAETISRLAANGSLLETASAAATRFSTGHNVDRWVDELVEWIGATS